MICTGTGIAPYISFLQEFKYRSTTSSNTDKNSTINPNTLIFGSRNRHFDFIYEEDLREFNKTDILNSIHSCFSRDQDRKYYVQHVVEELKENIEQLTKGELKIYICGGVSMGQEVIRTLEKILGNETLKKLEQNNLIVKELWG